MWHQFVTGDAVLANEATSSKKLDLFLAIASLCLCCGGDSEKELEQAPMQCIRRV